MATAFEHLNRSLETNKRSEKSRRVFKKPRRYKDEFDGCIDTWIEVMKLHFEEEDLSERQECSALTSNLEGTALNCVMAKKQHQRDTAEKLFEILLNRFGSGVQGHQAMMRFEKRRQREDETIDKFLDDLEMLRRRSQPDESNSRMNLEVASKLSTVYRMMSSNNVGDTLHTTINQCAYTRRVETQIKGVSLTKASIEIWLLQEQLWQF